MDYFEEHIDSDTLAAFDERALTEREMNAVFAHLGDCGVCRECLAIHSSLRSPRRSKSALVLAMAAAALLLSVVYFTSSHRASNLRAEKLSTQEYLKRWNSERFLREVALAPVSFHGYEQTHPRTYGPMLLQTSLGERRIWLTSRSFYRRDQDIKGE